MSDGVLIALIGAVSATVSVFISGVLAIFLSLVNRKVSRTQKAAETAVGQLENGHVSDPDKTSNIRDEISENHAETIRLFRLLRYQVAVLTQLLNRTVGRVDDIEKTGPVPGKGKHRDQHTRSSGPFGGDADQGQLPGPLP